MTTLGPCRGMLDHVAPSKRFVAFGCEDKPLPWQATPVAIVRITLRDTQADANWPI